MALIALVIGAATSIAATGRITFMLLASGTACWSFVPLVQLFTGVLLVHGSSLPRARALELYFQTHRPWSLWLLGFAALVLVLPNPGGWILFLAATFIIPMLLTHRRLKAVCRTELGFSPAIARRRLMVYQAVTAASLVAYGEYASRLLPRFIDGAAR
jgi:hypothetical protein